MLVTNNAEWAARARYLTTQAKDDAIEYVHNAVGYNYRLDERAGGDRLRADGTARLYVEAKRQIARRYEESLFLSRVSVCRKRQTGRLAPFGCIRSESMRKNHASTRASFCANWPPEKSRLVRSGSRFIARRLRPFRKSSCCPNPDALYGHAIGLPCSVGLTRSAQDHVIEIITVGADPSAMER